MAYKLANGDYRHRDVLIRRHSEPCSTGFTLQWEIRDVGNHHATGLHRQKFDTLKQASNAIDAALVVNLMKGIRT